jgi:hypothetical protein
LSIKITQNLILEVVDGHFEETNYRESAFFTILLDASVYAEVYNIRLILPLPLPASTQWEMVREAAEAIEPASEELIRQAAQGEVLHNDDTTAVILETIRDPAHKEHEEMLDWLGGDYDAEAFSGDEVNRRLAPLQGRWKKSAKN